MIDDLDRRIIARLVEDGRVSNKSIAIDLGVSEPTIAVRIRSLIEDGTIRIVAQRSLHVSKEAGVASLIQFWLKDLSEADVIHIALRDVPQIFSLYETTGSPELVAHCQAGSMAELNRTVAALYARFPQTQITTTPILELVQYKISFFLPEVAPARGSPPKNVRDRMIALLEEDGRQTIRMLSQRLGLAETSIRQRLRKLQSSPGFKIGAVTNPFHMGLSIWSDIRICAESGKVYEVIERLRQSPQVYNVMHTSGRQNIMVFAVARSIEEMDAFIKGFVRPISAIQNLEAIRVARSLKYNYSFHM
ncbi:MAG TPA: Lrp/AsnC family transcriptional regulator [Steroidobacteraceae bacterium]|nr:Lrp/AsnC family transcriptional regulator [Steroidobacteraceae bacterium]